MLPDYKYFVTSTLYEGNPKAILEAMASGCVVVAPNVPGVNEVIKHKVTESYKNSILKTYSTS